MSATIIVTAVFIVFFSLLGWWISTMFKNEPKSVPHQNEDGVRPFLVYGHTDKGKGLIVEVVAKNSAEAFNMAELEYPDCRFNHANVK